MSKKKQEEEKVPETASELREYLNKKNSQARAARRALKGLFIIGGVVGV